MKDIFPPERMWRPRGELKAATTSSSSAAARTASRPPTTWRRTTASTTSPCSRRATSAPAPPGRNTTIIRSNYRTPEGAAFYKESVKLYEGLSAELDFNMHVLAARAPHARALRPGDDHDERARRGEPAARHRQPRDRPATRSRSSARRSTSRRTVTWPILGALYHPPGGIIRHDAVVWGYARGADRGGVEIHQGIEVTGIDVERARHRRPDDARRHRVRHRRQRAPPAGRRSSATSPACRCRSRRTSCRPSSPSR